MSDIDPISMTECVCILPRVAKKGERRNTIELVHLLADTSFKTKVFNQYFKVVADYKEADTRNRKEVMNCCECSPDLLRGSSAKMDGRGTLYVKDANDVLLEQVECCGKYNVMIHPEQSYNLSRGAISKMTTEYITTWYKEVEKDVMWYSGNCTIYIENSNEKSEFYEGFIQLRSDKTGTALKSRELVL